MYLEHGKSGDGSPFLKTMVLEVANESIYISFSGMIYNESLGEDYQGALYRPAPVNRLGARNLNAFYN